MLHSYKVTTLTTEHIGLKVAFYPKILWFCKWHSFFNGSLINVLYLLIFNVSLYLCHLYNFCCIS